MLRKDVILNVHKNKGLEQSFIGTEIGVTILCFTKVIRRGIEKAMNGPFSGYYSYLDSFYSPHPMEERNITPLSILPTVTTTGKVRRAVNRLLPKGRRHRGDVCVA